MSTKTVKSEVAEGKVKGTIKEDDQKEAKKIKKGDETGNLKLNALGTVWKYDLYIKSGLTLFIMGYWIFLLKNLNHKLTLSSYMKVGSKVGSKDLWFGFTPLFVIIGGYPILFFLKELYDDMKHIKDGKLFSMDPYWPICIDSANTLPKKLLQKGIIGKIDYKCLKKQEGYNNSQSKMLQDRAYTTTYSVFLLVLFFVTSDAGKFKGIIERDNPFIATTIQHVLFLALLIISNILLKNYYYISTYALDFFTQALQLLGALLILLITFIIYRIIYFYV
jgi:hypothetical protein